MICLGGFCHALDDVGDLERMGRDCLSGRQGDEGAVDPGDELLNLDEVVEEDCGGY